MGQTLRKPNVRPVKRDMLTLAEYLKNERLKIGVLSAEALVDLIHDFVAIPEGLITAKQIYVIEEAGSTQTIKLMEMATFAALADALLYRHKPPIQYLFNPKEKRPYKTKELGAIGMGWIDPYTGSIYPDLDIDPRIIDTFLNN